MTYDKRILVRVSAGYMLEIFSSIYFFLVGTKKLIRMLLIIITKFLMKKRLTKFKEWFCLCEFHYEKPRIQKLRVSESQRKKYDKTRI